jgi:glycosyltransferase involved in cell wall biosynthesis
MRITIVSYFCPPEVAAPASRVMENAAKFCDMGHQVTILTGFPNHPRGKIARGYKLRLIQKEQMGKVSIVRMGSWISPNTTTCNRLKSYLSLTAAQIVGSLATGPADVVIGTSPPLFTALAGHAVSVIKKCLFVFEVRDLWPENMIAIGAMKGRMSIQAMQSLEMFLYRKAHKIIAVTHGFKDYIQAKGILAEKVSVIPNGIDQKNYRPVEYPFVIARELGLQDHFIAAYIGTVCMNHGLQTLLDASELLLSYPDVKILIVGDGAERQGLEDQARQRNLHNVIFAGERPRQEMPAFHALSDVLVVLLKKADYFRRVIPSKIFMAMGMEKPVLIGIEGESRRIIEEAGAGLGVEPENPAAVVDGILHMRKLKAEGKIHAMSKSGREYVERYFDRDCLAFSYQQILMDLHESRKQTQL